MTPKLSQVSYVNIVSQNTDERMVDACWADLTIGSQSCQSLLISICKLHVSLTLIRMTKDEKVLAIFKGLML
jgi:hypothetical protein